MHLSWPIWKKMEAVMPSWKCSDSEEIFGIHTSRWISITQQASFLEVKVLSQADQTQGFLIHFSSEFIRLNCWKFLKKVKCLFVLWLVAVALHIARHALHFPLLKKKIKSQEHMAKNWATVVIVEYLPHTKFTLKSQ